MTCKFLDSYGQTLHEGDTVLLDKPGTDGKVIGKLTFNFQRGMWMVAVEKVFSSVQQQFIPVNCGAVEPMAALNPHVRLFSHILKNVLLLEAAPRARRRAWSYEAPECY